MLLIQPNLFGSSHRRPDEPDGSDKTIDVIYQTYWRLKVMFIQKTGQVMLNPFTYWFEGCTRVSGSLQCF